MTIYVNEDEMHAKWCGGDESFNEALTELKLCSGMDWDKEPNVCPCTNWKNCGRDYEIVKFDNSRKPWVELSRESVLGVSAKGSEWEEGFGKSS